MPKPKILTDDEIEMLDRYTNHCTCLLCRRWADIRHTLEEATKRASRVNVEQAIARSGHEEPEDG